MEIFNFQILQLLGNKRKLLNIIKNSIEPYLKKNGALLDLFSGTSIVGYNFKNSNIVYANDIAPFAFIIAKALIQNNRIIRPRKIIKKLEKFYLKNKHILIKNNKDLYFKEKDLLKVKNIDELVKLNKNLFEDLIDNFNLLEKKHIKKYRINNDKIPYSLFTFYYSSNYFGLIQAIEIDSIRFAIEHGNFDDIEKSILKTSLFYAMNKCSFSRDGHFAQVINFYRSKKRLFNLRKESIYKNFKRKLNDFGKDSFITNKKMKKMSKNYVYSEDYKDVLNNSDVMELVDVIYADPPYTTNKYSRYYHILDTLVLYDYPKISKGNDGHVTKGLYREERYKSQFCSKLKAINEIENLFNICKKNRKIIVFSYAYPSKPEVQDTSRYAAKISDIFQVGEKVFGKSNFIIKMQSYEHSNQRRTVNKKVNEFVMIGKY